MKYLAIILILFPFIINKVNAEQSFTSGDSQVSVIELYTSEGCSSCPPADRWMSRLRNNQDLWSKFIPMAFHVDYWDYIGWKDPFASQANSQRQRRYAAEYNERTVYTPGVRRNGKEWRGWLDRGANYTEAEQKVGALSLSVMTDHSFKATFSPLSNPLSNPVINRALDDNQGSQSRLQFNIAVLGMGLTQNVTDGENEGKSLDHDFVVLGRTSVASAESNTWSGELPEIKTPAPQYAVVAWLSEAGKLTPIQATGGLVQSLFKNDS